MHTVVETSLFRNQWPSLWTPAIHDEFAARISEQPLIGKIIQGARSLRGRRRLSEASVNSSPIFRLFEALELSATQRKQAENRAEVAPPQPVELLPRRLLGVFVR